jgi:PhoH-like ATPase
LPTFGNFVHHRINNKEILAMAAARKQKMFVLDTNVILHDSKCMFQFEENDIVIPITVLEELDGFKKGNESINFQAREFLRAVDGLAQQPLFGKGVKIGKDLGNLIVKVGGKYHDDLRLAFESRTPDHEILNVAYRLSREFRRRQIILVSKDVNLRMKAKALGLMAQDYRNDHVKDISSMYTGIRLKEHVDGSLVDRMYAQPFTIAPGDLGFEQPLVPNEYLILRNGKKSALATYDSDHALVRRVDKLTAYGISPRNAEQAFALNALANPEVKLVSISGKAGTGKTLLALAAALERKKEYRQIFMARPVVPLSNKDIGYLPGDIQSKLDPYMQPLYDNLGVIQNQWGTTDTRHKRIREMLDEEKLVIAPLAYIRGRSLVNIFFIVDEAQNLTPHEVKTIITRAGDGTKLVFTGDIFQIDHPYLNSHSNGLSYLIEKMHGQSIYAHINLTKGERSQLAELASNLL